MNLAYTSTCSPKHSHCVLTSQAMFEVSSSLHGCQSDVFHNELSSNHLILHNCMFRPRQSLPFRFNNAIIHTSPLIRFNFTSHQVKRRGHLPSNFVPKGFGRDDGGFLTDTLVGMEIHCQTSVVLLDDDLSGLFHCLCTHTTL